MVGRYGFLLDSAMACCMTYACLVFFFNTCEVGYGIAIAYIGGKDGHDGWKWYRRGGLIGAMSASLFP